MAHSSALPDSLLGLLKSAHLQRLARFGLIDEVPSQWDARAERPDSAAPAADPSKEA